MQIRVFGYMILLPVLQNQGLQQLATIAIIEATWLIMILANLIKNYYKVQKLVLILDSFQSLTLLIFLLSTALHIIVSGNTELNDTHQRVLIYCISSGIIAEFITVGLSFFFAILRYTRLRIRGKWVKNTLDVYYRTLNINTKAQKLGAILPVDYYKDDNNLERPNSLRTVNTVKMYPNERGKEEENFDEIEEERDIGRQIRRGTVRIRGRIAFRNSKISSSSTRKNSVKAQISKRNSSIKKRSIFQNGSILSSQNSPLMIPVPGTQLARNGRRMTRMKMTGVLSTP